MSWLHILPLLAVNAAAVSASELPTPPADAANIEQLKLQQERYERVTVPVTIKGQGPFRFMVDTGAQATVVSSALAARLAPLRLLVRCHPPPRSGRHRGFLSPEAPCRSAWIGR